MKSRLVFMVIFLAIWVGGLSYAFKSWAGNESIPTTTGLDLDTVSLQIISPPDLENHLYKRTQDHFAKAAYLGIRPNPRWEKRLPYK